MICTFSLGWTLTAFRPCPHGHVAAACRCCEDQSRFVSCMQCASACFTVSIAIERALTDSADLAYSSDLSLLAKTHTNKAQTASQAALHALPPLLCRMTQVPPMLLSGPSYRTPALGCEKERRIHVRFRVPYHTSWGQDLVITGTGEPSRENPVGPVVLCFWVLWDRAWCGGTVALKSLTPAIA